MLWLTLLNNKLIQLKSLNEPNKSGVQENKTIKTRTVLLFNSDNHKIFRKTNLFSILRMKTVAGCVIITIVISQTVIIRPTMNKNPVVLFSTKHWLNK